MFTMVNKLYLKQLQINQRENFLLYQMLQYMVMDLADFTLMGLVVFLALSVPYWGLFGDSEPERSSLQDLNVILKSLSL